jgi:dihydroorotate dehydrogenase electron transfer subunit
MAETPAMYHVIGTHDESESARTVWLSGRAPQGDAKDESAASLPGRFFMVWIPGLDVKPYALSHLEAERFAITVEVRGKFSKRLSEARRGDIVGLRGPYGEGFKVADAPVEPTARRRGSPQRGRKTDRVCMVAGGMGLAAMALLCEAHTDAPLLYGARTAGEALFVGRFPNMRLFTDDGSAGEKGFPTDALAEVIASDAITLVCTCGPEAMMSKVFEICEKSRIECRASLERYMKCAIGVCGQCACGEMLVCRDGPVFGSQALRGMADFGRQAMLKNGRIVPASEYFSQPGRP